MNRASRIPRIVVLALIAAAGAWLRMHDLAQQIPMDDEWHGLDFALSRDAWFLLTHFSRAGANSVPYNVYLRVLLSSVGWGEVTIVLPSLVGGIVLLWFFPGWVWRRFGAVTGFVTATLLAMSPFLIFYSRVARAYSAMFLLQTVALVALAEWLRAHRRRDAIAFALSGGMAIWIHATAVPALASAVTVAVFLGWRRRRSTPNDGGPTARAVVMAGLGTLALGGLLWLPALRSPMPEVFHALGRPTLRTFTEAWLLVCGTGSSWAAVLCLVAALVGTLLALREHGREVLLFAGAVVGSVLAVVVGRPNASGTAGVLVRYSLPCFLLLGLGLGFAGQSIIDRLAAGRPKVAATVLIAALLGALLMLGPLPSLYGGVNSFTKHPTFGFDVRDYGDERARPDPLGAATEQPLRRGDLQPFYQGLARTQGQRPIIEYPFLLGEDANLFYFAQQVHRRPVLAGYRHSGATDKDVFGFAVPGAPSPQVRPPSSGYITNAMMVDHVLGRRPDNPGFRTLVAIDDPKALAQSGAEYLVLHWNLLREHFHVGPEWAKSAFVAEARAKLVELYGVPLEENEVITVFCLSGPRPRGADSAVFK